MSGTRFRWPALAVAATLSVAASLLQAQPVIYSNSATDLMAMASRPGVPGRQEIETADDFVLGGATRITGGSFTGLVPLNWTAANVLGVTVEMYQVFPVSSVTPPSTTVPTRVNSPSDVALASRSGSGLSFTTTVLSQNFTAINSVRNGINPSPNQTTGGEGAVTGQEVRFDFTLINPFDLFADHYFFVAQVALSSGDFYWLSGTRPITGGGNTPFLPDLQAWIRNDALDPNWLRVGTDIVGGAQAPQFNTAFTLNGTPITTTPEPGTNAMVVLGMGAVGVLMRRRGRSTIR